MADQLINLSEISELLEEDTDGLLLAQFLQKKRGAVRHCRFALLNHEPEPFSFNVKVRELDTPPENTGNAQQELIEQQIQGLQQKSPAQQQLPLANKTIVQQSENVIGRSDLPSDLPVGNPQSPSVSLTPRRNNALSSGDRLRRSSLKRLHTLNVGGRRTLLKEFENTLSTTDFSPPVCSTPMHAALPPRSPTQTLSKENAPAENIANKSPHLSTPNSSAAVNESDPIETNSLKMISSLRRRDGELRDMLKDIVECTLKEAVREKEKSNAAKKANITSTTSQDIQQSEPLSAHRRIFTLQTGNLPGQVVLTPTHSPAAAMQRTPTRASAAATMQQSPTYSPKSPTKRNSLHTSDAILPSKQAKIISVKRSEDLLESPEKIKEFYHAFDITPRNRTRHSNRCTEVMGTPACNRKTHRQQEIQEEDELEIPETQQLHTDTNKLVNSIRKSGPQSPMVIIPITQTFNGTPLASPIPVAAEEAALPANNREKTILQTEEIEENHQMTCNTKDTSQNATRSNTTRASNTYNNNNGQATLTSMAAGHAKSLSSKVGDIARTSTGGTAVDVTLTSGDELRLCDIITDDEDESMPLNLAPPPTNINTKRTRRERKASQAFTRMHLEEHKNNSTTIRTTNTKSGGPPPAHPLNLRSRNHRERYPTRRSTTIKESRKCIPLNKAPNTPINGEKFAGELKTQLARLNNRQILDLRKRNSLGKIYTEVSKRKSTAAEIFEKRIQLEEEIEFEILRRTLEGNSDGLDKENEDAEEIESAGELCGLPSAPEGFKDLSAQATAGRRSAAPIVSPAEESPADEVERAIFELHREEAESSSLVDERRSDRISFIPPPKPRESLRDSRSRNCRRKKDTKSEIVKSYIAATQTIKSNKRKSNKTVSKRSLYTKGFSDSENSMNSSAEKLPCSSNNLEITEVVNIMAIPSPPREEQVQTNEIRIVSPPPPPPSPSSSLRVTRSLRSSTYEPPETENIGIKPHEDVLPPPLPFLDQEAATTESDDIPQTLATTMTTKDRSIDDEIFKKPPIPAPRKARGNSKKDASLSDAEIFKKPLLPAPKNKRGRNPKPTLKALEVVELERGQSTPLRRSKRAHVAPDNSFLESMWRKIERQRQNYATKKARKTLQENESLPIASSTQNPQTSTPSSNSSSIGFKTKPTQKKATRNKQVEQQREQSRPPYSLLGDTNASSSSSMTSEAPTPMPLYGRRLSPIYEPEAAEYEPELELVNKMPTALPTSSFSPPPVSQSYSPKSSQALSPIPTFLPPSSPRRTINDDEVPTTSKNVKAKPRKKSAAINDELPATSKNIKAKKNKKVAAKLDNEVPTTSQYFKTKKENKVADPFTKSTKTGTKHKKQNSLECSRLIVPPAPVEQLNNIFEQLKNASTISTRNETVFGAAALSAPIATTTMASPQKSTTPNASSTQSAKRLCVRLKRCKVENTGGFSSFSSSTSTSNNNGKIKKKTTTTVAATTKPTTATQSNITATNKSQQQQEKVIDTNSTKSKVELLTWLKGISDMYSSPSPQHVKIFEEMHVSAAGNLMFSNLEGVEYAFYDTNNRASLGYLRFRPHQLKPEKRAKKYHLHFVVLEGTFEIKTNHDIGSFGIGDMVAINIGSRYTIKNICDDIGLLMVIKK